MSSRSVRFSLLFWVLIASVAVLGACGDLEVDLDDEKKDELAAYVERGGRSATETPAPRRTLDVSGITTLEHVAWEGVVSTYVRDGVVDYSGFWASEDSREVLEGYLDLLASLDPAQLESPEERLAFWINAYNALVFRNVAERVASNPDFSTSDDDFLFFQESRYLVGGAQYSLDLLEHGVIRGDEGHASMQGLGDAEKTAVLERHEAVFSGPVDPRIHVALNCGAVSCPSLPSKAFRAEGLDAFLRERTVLFVQDAQKGAGPEGVSSLFNWFKSDFEGGPEGSVMGFVEEHRGDVSDVNFGQFLDYDWALNGE